MLDIFECIQVERFVVAWWKYRLLSIPKYGFAFSWLIQKWYEFILNENKYPLHKKDMNSLGLIPKYGFAFSWSLFLNMALHSLGWSIKDMNLCWMKTICLCNRVGTGMCIHDDTSVYVLAKI